MTGIVVMIRLTMKASIAILSVGLQAPARSELDQSETGRQAGLGVGRASARATP
ncbi:hypothetical protein ABE438_08740 [Bosea sp. TWI1241]|uniref:hypothetical protein n=1 Tax=Bosea sp. TWI1241 TaxID=3148904 RepID=UPI003209A213